MKTSLARLITIRITIHENEYFMTSERSRQLIADAARMLSHLSSLVSTEDVILFWTTLEQYCHGRAINTMLYPSNSSTVASAEVETEIETEVKA